MNQKLLHEYAMLLYHGVGCSQDIEKAQNINPAEFPLVQMNTSKFKQICSIAIYSMIGYGSLYCLCKLQMK